MNIRLSRPKRLPVEKTRLALKMMMIEGPFVQAMGMLIGGTFLIAFILELTDSKMVVGCVMALGPLAMVMQTPATILVERLRKRKSLTIIGAIVSRSMWLFIPFIPFVVSRKYILPVLAALLFVSYAFGNLSQCAYRSWLRDLIPDRVMSKFLSRRLSVLIAAGALTGLAAGIFADRFKEVTGDGLLPYSLVLGIGGVIGMLGLFTYFRMPETPMAERTGQKTTAMLAEPFRDANFRNWLIFLALWNFAIGISGAFFVVHMLQRLNLSMTWIMGLGMVSQGMMVAFSPLWGKIASKMSSKSVLRVCTTTIMITFIMWTFTTMPEQHSFTIPLLFAMYLLGGLAWGGFWVCVSTLPLKAAPKGRATAYLSANALVGGLAATIGPITGGFLADLFQDLEFSIPLQLSVRDTGVFSQPALSFSSFDFLFIISFLIGMLAIHRLKKVREANEAPEKRVVEKFYREVFQAVRLIGHMTGIRTGSVNAVVSPPLPNQEPVEATTEDVPRPNPLQTSANASDSAIFFIPISVSRPGEPDRDDYEPPQKESAGSVPLEHTSGVHKRRAG